MEHKRTLKEIALELLWLYRDSEARWIEEFCVDIDGELDKLGKEIEALKREIEDA